MIKYDEQLNISCSCYPQVPQVEMSIDKQVDAKQVLRNLYNFFLRCILYVLAVGPLPIHIAFIMDGNRRYAKKNNIEYKNGYRPGFIALTSIIKQCYELGVRYITIYGFSIDNFRRKPEEVKRLMKLLREKIEAFVEDDIFIKRYGVRIYFVGNLALLSEELQVAATKAMEITAKNTTTHLLVCIAYTSTDEIAHAVEECYLSCGKNGDVDLLDIEKKIYMSIAPEPDILIRTSGETRLSNFLLWQTERCLLYSPAALWPELSLWHLVWAMLNFQKHYYYLHKKRKSS